MKCSISSQEPERMLQIKRKTLRIVDPNNSGANPWRKKERNFLITITDALAYVN